MKELMPELRFSEFEGEWMEMKLGDYFNVNMCKRIFANETREYGDVPFYKIGTLGKEPDAYISRELFETYKAKYKYPRTGAVLISCSGTVGKCVVFNGEDSYYQDSNIVWLENNEELISDIFLYLLLIKVDWSRLNSTTITRIYSSDLKGVRVKYPNLVEQTKIADFLSAVDEQISLLTEKQEKLQTYKRGVMQKLFSQELRFKDEHGADYPEWEEKEFEDVFTSVSTRKYQVNKSDYQDEGSFPIVDQGQRKVIGYSSESDKVYRNGEVIVFGDHTTILKYIDFDFIVGADGVKLLVSKGESNLRYLYYSLVVNNVQSEGYKRHFSILKEITLFIHSLPEQTKIANFLTAIDGQLEEVEAQIAQTRVFKQGLLQKMFV